MRLTSHSVLESQDVDVTNNAFDRTLFRYCTFSGDPTNARFDQCDFHDCAFNDLPESIFTRCGFYGGAPPKVAAVGA